MAYKSFLIRKLNDSNDMVYASDVKWNIYVKKFPFKLYPEMKDVASRSWHDRQGDEEFVPEQPVFKAYTMEVGMVYKGPEGNANHAIKEFLHYLSHGGMCEIYDQYTGIGRTNVRYVGYREDAFFRKEGKEDVVEFTITLKVNNPIDTVVLKLKSPDDQS